MRLVSFCVHVCFGTKECTPSPCPRLGKKRSRGKKGGVSYSPSSLQWFGGPESPHGPHLDQPICLIINERIQAVSERSVAHAGRHRRRRQYGSKANGPTVSPAAPVEVEGRHESHSQRKERKKGARRDLQTQGQSRSAPRNTCSCTALLITGGTEGPSQEKGLPALDSVFYSICSFNLLLLIQETIHSASVQS